VAAFVSQTGPDGNRFPSGRQLVGFIFLPVIEESGDQRATPRLSWRGPKYLRWALYMAAVASIRHNPELRALYHKKRSQGKEPKQAIICVAVKLAQMMLSMLKSGAPYDPARVFVRR
jgi:transposase